MTDEESDRDPLARLAKPFLGLIGLVWLLALALLILQLVSTGGEVDGNVLILVGVLLGIALLPFVSQFSVAGLFEFKREIGKLAGEVEEVKNQLSSISAASASAQQQTTSSTTQQLILTTANLQELAQGVPGVELSIGETEPQLIAEELEETEDQAIGLGTWKAAWLSLQVLLTLLHVRHKAEERGFDVVSDIDTPIIELFKQATDYFFDSDAFEASQIEFLLELLEQNRRIEDQGVEADAEALQKLFAFVSILYGQLFVFVAAGEAAYSGLVKDPEGGSEIVHEINDNVKKALVDREAEKTRKTLKDKRVPERRKALTDARGEDRAGD